MILGVSNIRHSVRKKLQLSLSEYVILDYLQICAEDQQPPTDTNAQSLLGESLASIQPVFARLEEKKLLENINGKLVPTNKWTQNFKFKQKDFLHYWSPVMIEGKEIRWRSGSSKEAIKRRIKDVVKEVELEFLIYQKLRYFVRQFSSGGIDYIMGPEKFIGRDKFYNAEYRLNEEQEDLLHSIINENFAENVGNSQFHLDLRKFLKPKERKVPVKDKPEEPESKNWFDD